MTKPIQTKPTNRRRTPKPPADEGGVQIPVQIPAEGQGPAKTRAENDAPTPHSEFFDRLASQRFGGDVDRSLDRAALERVIGRAGLERMLARAADPSVRDVADKGTEVSPRKVYRAWAAQMAEAAPQDVSGRKSSGSSASFTNTIEHARHLLAELRSKPTAVSFGGRISVSFDILGAVGAFDPIVSLARTLAESADLGGTDLLGEALERADLPDDIAAGVRTQLQSIPKVTRTTKGLEEPKGVERPGSQAALSKALLNRTADGSVFTHRFNLGAEHANAPQVAEASGMEAESAATKPGTWTAFWTNLGALLEDADLSDVFKAAALDGAWKTIALQPIENRTIDAGKEPVFAHAIELLAGNEKAQASVLASANAPETLYLATLSREDRQRIIKNAIEQRRPNEQPSALGFLIRDSKKREEAFGADWAPKLETLNRFPFIYFSESAAVREKLGDIATQNITQDVYDFGAPLQGIPRAVAEGVKLDVMVAKLLDVGRAALFSPPPDEQKVSPQLLEVAQKDLPLPVHRNFFGIRNVGPPAELLKSQAVSLLGLQLREKVLENPGRDAKARIEKAIRESNPALFEVLGAVFKNGAVSREFVLEAAKAKTSRTSVEMNYALKLAAEVAKSSDGKIDGAITELVQHVIKSTGSLQLLPYAGGDRFENREKLDALPPTSFARLYLLDRLDLPHDTLAHLCARAAEVESHDNVTAQVYQSVLLGRALDAHLQPEAFLPLLARTLKSSTLGMVVGLRAMAERGLGFEQGKEIIRLFENTKPSPRQLATFVSAAEELADEGKLFNRQDVVALGMKRDPEALLRWVTAPRSTLKDQPLEVRRAVLRAVFDTPPDHLAPHALALAREVNLLRASGEDIRLPDAILKSALAKAGTTILFERQLAALVSEGARATQRSEGEVAELILESKGSARPEDLAAKLRVLGGLPNIDEAVMKLSLDTAGIDPKADLPFAACLELAARPDLSAEAVEKLVSKGLEWAGKAGAFYALEQSRQRIGERDPLGQKLSVIDRVAAELVQRPDSPWQKVASARRAAVGPRLEAYRADLDTLVDNPKDSASMSRHIAARLGKEGSLAADLADRILSDLRFKIDVRQPSLADIDTALGGVQKSVRAGEVVRPKGPQVELFGERFPVYSGERVVDVPSAEKMVAVPTWLKNRKPVVSWFIENKKPLLWLGSSGAGKTSTIEDHLCGETQTPCFRLVGHNSATEEEIFGTWKSKNGVESFEPAPALEVYLKGGVLLVDEFNLYPERIQKLLGKLIRGHNRGEFEEVIGGKPVRLRHSPDCKMILCGNMGLKDCQKILGVVRDEVDFAYARPIPSDELAIIMREKFPDIPQEELKKACDLQALLEEMQKGFRGSYPTTIRNLERACTRFLHYRGQGLSDADLMARECREVYLDGIADPTDLQKATAVFKEYEIRVNDKQSTKVALFGVDANATRPSEDYYQTMIHDDRVTLGDATLIRGPGPVVRLEDLKVSFRGYEVPVIRDPVFMRLLYQVFKAFEIGESVLLLGPQDSRKQLLFDAVAKMTGWYRPAPENDGPNEEPPWLLLNYDCTPQNTADDFLGTETLRAVMKNDTTDGAETARKGKMVNETYFADGMITRRARRGGIAVLRNVNELKGTTTGRLFPLMEGKRRFTLRNGEPIDMDPGFHLGATMRVGSGGEGRISLAFANRTQAIYCPLIDRAGILRGITTAAELPEYVADQMLRFEGAWDRLFDARKLAPTTDEYNLPPRNFERLTDWLDTIARAYKKSYSEKDLNQAFIDGAVNFYKVPDEHKGPEEEGDLRKIAEALAAGNEAAFKALAPGEPEAAPAPAKK